MHLENGNAGAFDKPRGEVVCLQRTGQAWYPPADTLAREEELGTLAARLAAMRPTSAAGTHTSAEIDPSGAAASTGTRCPQDLLKTFEPWTRLQTPKL